MARLSWKLFPEKPTEVRIAQNKKHYREATIIGDEQESDAPSYDREDRQLIPSSLCTRTYRQNQVVTLFQSYFIPTVAPALLVGCQISDETNGSSSNYLAKFLKLWP